MILFRHFGTSNLTFFCFYRYLRDDFNCLGSFPLNITNFPEIKNPEQSTSLESDKTSFPKVLYSLISTILPKSVYLECSLDNLNDLSFIPKYVLTIKKKTNKEDIRIVK